MHEEEWIEIGYLLDKKIFDKSILDDSLASKSSLRNLKQMRSQSFEELIRGKTYSFGGIVNAKFPSYKAVPSPNNLSPYGGNYFNGGNIIQYHTMNFNSPSFKFAGFQMELPPSLRIGVDLTTTGKNLAACIYEYYFVNAFDLNNYRKEINF